MKKIIFHSVLTGILFTGIASCKKENTAARNSDNAVVVNKVKTVTFTGTQGTSLYQNPNTAQVFYNADGSISKYVYLDAALNQISTRDFYYAANKVTRIETAVNGTVSMYEEWFTNNNGDLDSLVSGQAANNLISSCKVLYDAQGNIIEAKSYLFNQGGPTQPVLSGSEYYTYANGNMVQWQPINAPEVLTFEYSDIGDNISICPGTNELIKSDKLVSKVYIHTAADPQPELYIIYDYTFDSNNRVVTETNRYCTNGVDNGTAITRTFTY